MTRRFQQYSLKEFVARVRSFPWAPAGKKFVDVHHTWRPNHSQYRGEETIRSMWRYHTVEKKWADIAQHVSVAPDGTIWSGRDWNSTPVSALGYNSPSVFMFETIGDFDVGMDVLEGRQLEAVLIVTAAIQDQFGLPLWSSVRFHNQMSSKSCPGSAIDRAQFIVQLREAHKRLLNYEAAITESITAAIQPASETVQEHAHDESLQAYWVRQDCIAAAAATLTGAGSVSLEGMAATDASPAWLGALAEADVLVQGTIGEAEAGSLSDEQLLERMAAMSVPATEGIIGESLERIGARIFERLERELHAVVCGSAEQDRADRQAILQAIGLDRDTAAAALTAFLIGGLGVAPAIAGIAGALLFRRVVGPAIEAGVGQICSTWSNRFNAAP